MYIYIDILLQCCFLVTDQVRSKFIEPDVALAQLAMLKQTFDMYEDLKRDGKLKFSYAFTDLPGGITS